MKFTLLINMKMPTRVGIFIFISRENVFLSWVKHEKSIMTSGPGIQHTQKGCPTRIQTVNVQLCLPFLQQSDPCLQSPPILTLHRISIYWEKVTSIAPKGSLPINYHFCWYYIKTYLVGYIGMSIPMGKHNSREENSEYLFAFFNSAWIHALWVGAH